MAVLIRRGAAETLIRSVPQALRDEAYDKLNDPDTEGLAGEAIFTLLTRDLGNPFG